MQWKVIRIVDGPIESLDRIEEMPCGEIGELIVCGPVVTRQYVTRLESNALGKIADGPRIWHRMGDAGYLDANDRFWFCGRLAHRVLAAGGPMYTIPCEAIFNQHPSVCRSALVGVGPPGATPGHHPRAHAERLSANDRGPTQTADGDTVSGTIEAIDLLDRRLSLSSWLSGGHSPQRQNIPRKTGTLGRQAPWITTLLRRVARPEECYTSIGLILSREWRNQKVDYALRVPSLRSRQCAGSKRGRIVFLPQLPKGLFPLP